MGLAGKLLNSIFIYPSLRMFRSFRRSLFFCLFFSFGPLFLHLDIGPTVRGAILHPMTCVTFTFYLLSLFHPVHRSALVSLPYLSHSGFRSAVRFNSDGARYATPSPTRPCVPGRVTPFRRSFVSPLPKLLLFLRFLGITKDVPHPSFNTIPSHARAPPTICFDLIDQVLIHPFSFNPATPSHLPQKLTFSSLFPV